MDAVMHYRSASYQCINQNCFEQLGFCSATEFNNSQQLHNPINGIEKVVSSSHESRLEIKRYLSAQFDGKAMEIFASHQLAFAAPFGYKSTSTMELEE